MLPNKLSSDGNIIPYTGLYQICGFIDSKILITTRDKQMADRIVYLLSEDDRVKEESWKKEREREEKKKYNLIIDQHYDEYGVGWQISDKLKHWKKYYTDMFYYTLQCKTDEDFVKAYESIWWDENKDKNERD
jgi:hypothetical protein